MKQLILKRKPLGFAVLAALSTSAAIQVAHAGAGWGDSALPGNYDPATYVDNGWPVKVPTFYANSPSGMLPATACFNQQPKDHLFAFDPAGIASHGLAYPTDAANPASAIGSIDDYATLIAADPALTLPSYCDTGTALRKFVDPVPTLNGTGTTPGGTAAGIPVAVPNTPYGTPYPGSDYYEIAVVEYAQKMHSDLPKATELRGYVQIVPSTYAGAIALTNPDGSIIKLADGTQAYAAAAPSYLGPIISSTRGTPTRIKFMNLLPAGSAGNLKIPVDETISGAGFGPDGVTKYQQNRMEIHLHGGDNPWISDGTPHQWILPAADEIALKAAGKSAMARGVGAVNVPDMPDPGPGAMTYYFPNGETGRLMFYHDHVVGLTRLNVYAGVAAGYLLNDKAGEGEHNAALEPILASIPQLPLVIQDKTFVPANIAVQDAKWDTTQWGQPGDLWFPHVYETNQDPASLDGTNGVGRWDWGSWFWPVFPSSYNLPEGTNTINAATKLSEVSTTPEGFMDTAVVNGTAYPTVNVEPKTYRFRMLNAGNDRMLNLGFYVASTSTGVDPTQVDPSAIYQGSQPCIDNSTIAPSTCTEVKMVNFDSSYAAPAWVSPNGTTAFPSTGGITGSGWGTPNAAMFPQGAPDPALAGPHIVQIGSEGGLLANPLDIPSTPINYEYNKRSVTVLNVLERGLWLGNAERADVLVDFSQYAGKTLILFNDAPAPAPASDPRIDYYTGMGDNTGVGGAANVMPGYGPNTRTIMQFVVGTSTTGTATTLDATTMAALKTGLNKAFGDDQPKPIVPEPQFKAAYSATVGATNYNPVLAAAAQRIDAKIYTGTVYLSSYQGMNFTTPEAITYLPAPTCTTATNCAAPTATVTAAAGTAVKAYVQNKAIQELFDPAYGRMNATLGIELPFTSALTQTTIPLGYVDPATETVADGETQFWKITHNGVDSHPVHFHLVNVQVINRVGWDGTVKAPYGDEIGWKETVRMHPLEDIIVAVRAKKPSLAGVTGANNFGLPLSQRLMDPSQPVGTTVGFTQVNPITGQPATVTNQVANYQWEYVWHCHILGHEENDFMRPVIFDAKEAAAAAPTGLAAVAATAPATGVVLTWTDAATTEYAYKVERKAGTGATGTWTVLSTVPAASQVAGSAPLANAKTFTDTTTLASGTTYQYRVTAIGANGNGVTTVNYSTGGTVTGPAAPTNVSINRSSTNQAVVSWTDASTNETSFQVQTSIDGGTTWTLAATVNRSASQGTAVNGTVTGNVTVSNSTNAKYRVVGYINTTAGTPSAVVTLNDTVAPVAATGLSGSRGLFNTVTIRWTDTPNNNATYNLQRATIGSNTWSNVQTGIAGNATQSIALIQPTNVQYRLVSVNSAGTATSAPVSVP